MVGFRLCLWLGLGYDYDYGAFWITAAVSASSYNL